MELPESLIKMYRLSESFRDSLKAATFSVSKQKNEHLLNEGSICKNIWLLRSGLVRNYFKRNGTEVTVAFMRPGEFVVAIESFIEQKASDTSIQAIEDCSLQAVHIHEVRKLLANFAETRLIGEFMKREHTKSQLLKIKATSMHQPVDRYQFFCKHFEEIHSRIKLEHIASYLDVSKSTLARSRRR